MEFQMDRSRHFFQKKKKKEKIVLYREFNQNCKAIESRQNILLFHTKTTEEEFNKSIFIDFLFFLRQI